VPLPRVAEARLRRHLAVVRRLHESDLARGLVGVPLPGGSPRNTRTPLANGPGSGSSPRRASASTRPRSARSAITFTRPSCSGRSSSAPHARGSPSP
jgi:hypothetical protein